MSLAGKVLRARLALLSVYDKANLIDLATALSQSGVRLLGSGGTAKKIRDAGLTVEWVQDLLHINKIDF